MSSAPLEDHDDGGGGGAAPPSRRRQHGVTYVSGAEGNENEVANEGSGDHVAVPVRGGGARGMANISAEDALVPPPDRARGAASSARGAAIGSSASGEEERETDEEEQEQDPDASLRHGWSTDAWTGPEDRKLPRTPAIFDGKKRRRGHPGGIGTLRKEAELHECR